MCSQTSLIMQWLTYVHAAGYSDAMIADRMHVSIAQVRARYEAALDAVCEADVGNRSYRVTGNLVSDAAFFGRHGLATIVGAALGGGDPTMANKATALDVQDLLEYGRAAVAVLRSLQISNSMMNYADFARAIGLIEGPKAPWQPWHRRQIGDILYAVAAIEQRAGRRSMPLEFGRIVGVKTGQPGQGLAKTSKIVVR